MRYKRLRRIVDWRLVFLLFLAPSAQGQGGTGIHATAGDLRLELRRCTGGISLERLRDVRSGQDLTAPEPLPLFSVTLRDTHSANLTKLVADAGWRECSVRQRGRRLHLRWSRAEDAALAGLSIAATVNADATDNSLSWELWVDNASTNWSVWRVVFPQLALADLGSNAAVLFPRGPGEVQRGVWGRPFTYRGSYANGWCSMQFVAAYREGESPTGLYVGLHDPWGSVKDLALVSEPKIRDVHLSFEHPAPGMGLPQNSFVLSGKTVWRLLRGDWFDATMVYKQWARREAKWWPKLAREGRADSPAWVRELNAWALTGGASSDCVPAVKRFREFLGMPIGFHWYNWHQIPFDNDYPHYFPAKPGFAEGVADLNAAGVFVMPYINGRLWDSHDRAAEDFEFTRIALPAVTKRADGSPYLEQYSSKETNGQPVRLGVMCPTMPLWQGTVSNIVLRLLRDCGTRGVYVDQVAAAAPELCQDSTHGHPLGGGHWWNEGYWKMLDAIRAAKPPGTMLTTECNAEPFIRWFDGYLTWHWQNDGQVPAFPAVYGGAIQMFGRAYRGGATKDLALRMKAGQQLVFGEQLGWLDPSLVNEKENADFFRQMTQLRTRLNRYFYAGEMARPPRFVGAIPKVRADWQWSGEWWVTTDSVLTGAWRQPKKERLVLLFVNVSDQEVTAQMPFDASGYGIRARQVHAQKLTAALAAPDAHDWPRIITRTMTFPPRHAEAWELTW